MKTDDHGAPLDRTAALRHPSRHPLRLGPQRKWSLYGLLALLLVTGAVWLWLQRTRADDALPSPLAPWMMKLHGGAAMLLIYLAGTLLHSHMANAWRARRNRGAGIAVAAVFGLLGATGYGLYYFSGDMLRDATEWLHWALGFAAAPLLGWHIWRGRLGAGPARPEGR
jgi:cation transport ATPase